MPDGKDPAQIQTEVFSVGKNYYPKEKLEIGLKQFMKLSLEMNKGQGWDRLLVFLDVKKLSNY